LQKDPVCGPPVVQCNGLSDTQSLFLEITQKTSESGDTSSVVVVVLPPVIFKLFKEEILLFSNDNFPDNFFFFICKELKIYN